MAFQKHARVNFGGALASRSGRSEEWSCTVAVSTHQAAGWWLDDPQAYMEAIAPSLLGWFISPASNTVQTASLEYLKVNNINPDGTYAEGVTHKHVFAPNQNGVNAPVGPTFLSYVTSFGTDQSRGYASRGRIYLPNNSFQCIGSQISQQNAAEVVTAGKALLSLLLINEPTGGNLVQPCIVSKHASELNDIQSVSCDDIADYQSRRKNRVVATRTTSDWP